MATSARRALVDRERDAGSIHFICGLLPPGYQQNRHPFGLLDYSTSFLGHTMLTNALGYVQRWFVGGEEVASFGGTSEFGVTEDPGETLTASGSRADDGSVFTGGEMSRFRGRLEPSR